MYKINANSDFQKYLAEKYFQCRKAQTVPKVFER